MEGKTLRKGKFYHKSGKRHEWSRIRVWWWIRARWWWWVKLIRNTKSRRKLVPQVKCSILEGAVCDLETGVDWWLEKSDQCRWSSGSRRLDCDEIAQVTWEGRLEELIYVVELTITISSWSSFTAVQKPKEWNVVVCQARRLAEIINCGIQPLQNLATLKKVVDITGVDSTKAEWAQHFIIKGFQGLLLIFQHPFHWISSSSS